MGRFGAILGRLWRPLGACWKHLCASWRDLWEVLELLVIFQNKNYPWTKKTSQSHVHAHAHAHAHTVRTGELGTAFSAVGCPMKFLDQKWSPSDMPTCRHAHTSGRLGPAGEVLSFVFFIPEKQPFAEKDRPETCTCSCARLHAHQKGVGEVSGQSRSECLATEVDPMGTFGGSFCRMSYDGLRHSGFKHGPPLDSVEGERPDL